MVLCHDSPGHDINVADIATLTTGASAFAAMLGCLRAFQRAGMPVGTVKPRLFATV
jgi:hypothetical protein